MCFLSNIKFWKNRWKQKFVKNFSETILSFSEGEFKVFFCGLTKVQKDFYQYLFGFGFHNWDGVNSSNHNCSNDNWSNSCFNSCHFLRQKNENCLNCKYLKTMAGLIQLNIFT
jgi:hypothetical protein